MKGLNGSGGGRWKSHSTRRGAFSKENIVRDARDSGAELFPLFSHPRALFLIPYVAEQLCNGMYISLAEQPHLCNPRSFDNKPSAGSVRCRGCAGGAQGAQRGCEPDINVLCSSPLCGSYHRRRRLPFADFLSSRLLFFVALSFSLSRFSLSRLHRSG